MSWNPNTNTSFGFHSDIWADVCSEELKNPLLNDWVGRNTHSDWLLDLGRPPRTLISQWTVIREDKCELEMGHLIASIHSLWFHEAAKKKGKKKSIPQPCGWRPSHHPLNHRPPPPLLDHSFNTALIKTLTPTFRAFLTSCDHYSQSCRPCWFLTDECDIITESCSHLLVCKTTW